MRTELRDFWHLLLANAQLAQVATRNLSVVVATNPCDGATPYATQMPY
jgi:hypothetical protein